MKLLGQILLACFILTALRWAVAVIAAAMVFGLVVALIRAPVQTLSVLFGWLLLCAFAAHPALGLALFILIILGGKLSAK
ncbi:hypothetical protein A9995_09035 [Erythrobacter sp. QSSC1-22B]|uniref:hypothetical protein n=1 Tax=Erythrobacter sp. QSSC1-22B TaxID=1860125 RepID=UPI000805A60F|nr:hypothetical protein [Erythrobacter sp. QSSC1-22B]OBX19251.1 hypothetical protein A9995_09035 [Erythrobacter sp. QSSC1-22B]